ncbi:SfnB family sulfur acquisition oxidoreductase [Aureimonas endophytica]|uniref:SfnB family sulfur acquisition oxidoreductase n=1 Tax=Aureimonas endophytica TaxID=2027858 RepID=A0A916ZRP6_9HYPH|nr:SfnB family sulfur acquisition oxidoreductase [Aureimonas endophytica]GGE10887.1 SfnB family sulfur acquisition oxidoreductase [Aureimonas endophytica]
MSALRPLAPTDSQSEAEAETRRIRDDAEAIAVARELAAELAPGAAERDRDRRLPFAELDRLSRAGLFAITVPKAYGGAGVKAGTLARVTAILAGADGSIGQIPQNHFFMLEGLRLEGTEGQKRFFYARVLAGERLGNALSERSTRTAHDIETRIRPDGAAWRLDGRKFYSTGALFADWIVAVAKAPDETAVIAFVRKGTDGLIVEDDWSGFGQRTTGSGTTIFRDVRVEPDHVVPYSALFDRPTPMGPHAQIIHAGVQQGLAEGALAETIRFVRDVARPWRDAGVARHADDPHVTATIGEVSIRVAGAAALLDRAGHFVDAASLDPTEETVAAASVAVAEAKIASTDAALLAGSRLIELGGASATLAVHDLDRFWRNARTHAVHDPQLWKYRFVGDYWLNGTKPPRHGAI